MAALGIIGHCNKEQKLRLYRRDMFFYTVFCHICLVKETEYTDNFAQNL